MLSANHASFGRPAGLKQQAAYDDFGRLLAKMIERANAQYDGHIAWMGDLTSPGVDTSAFDFAERQALDVSILSLNSLIERTRLGSDGWLDINCAAFNTVRASIGLGPLNGVEFRARYFQGLAGGSARFFRD